MNELARTTNAICECEQKDVAPQIMTICRAVTPQFYKGMADIDLKAEKLSIELLTSNIEQVCLAEMCKLAILNYPRKRSESEKVYFDINYILTFYKQAFNKVFCDLVELPKKSKLIESHFDYDTCTISEMWEDPNGNVIAIREIADKAKEQNNQRVYSSKFYKSMITDLDEVEI